MNDNQTRDLIAGLIMLTLCLAILCKIPLPDMFKDIVLMVIGFFFGSRGVSVIQTNGGTNEKSNPVVSNPVVTGPGTSADSK